MSVLNYAYFVRESFGTPKYNFCITDGRNNTQKPNCHLSVLKYNVATKI